MNIPKATAIPVINPINITSASTNSYDYSKLKDPLIYTTFFAVILVLIWTVIALIYSNRSSLDGIKSLSKNNNETIVIVLCFVSAFLLVVFLTIPNYRNLLTFIGKLKYVLLLLAYIIGLIVMYRDVPRGIVDAYSFLFFPATVLIGIVLFYLAMEKGILYGFDINYERVKYILIFYCLIVFMLLLYTVDPGGYLKSYFGPSLIVSILLIIFGFLYLVTLMNLPTVSSGSGVPGLAGTSSTFGGLFKGLTKMGLFSGIAFIIFLIVIVAGILAYPGGFLKNADIFGSDKTNKVSGIVILLIIIFALWILFFGILSFSGTSSVGNANASMENIGKIARQVFMLLFGLTFSGILIGWLVTSAESLSTHSGIVSFVLNAIIIVAVLGLVFKLITGGEYYKKTPFFRLVINTLLYIPCIFVGVIDAILSALGFGASTGKTGISGLWSGLSSTIESTKNTPYTYYVLLFIIIFLYIFYFFLGSQIQTNISKQGGTLLVNAPINTTSENTIGSYDHLNGTDETNLYDYKYAISFWSYIDAVSPNAHSSLNTFTSILNYGNKPNILYNAVENTLMITMENDGEPAIGSESRLKNPQELDSQGNIIIYKLENVLLQKWNHIVINYSNGTLDIFYNGKLVKSANEVVPKMSKDALTVGSNKGINGQICNVTYFNTEITASQIYYLYNTVKNKTPPVVNPSKESILKDVLAGAKIKTNPPVITIPFNIDVKSMPSKSEENPDPPIKSDPNKIYTEYLSFKWFSTANGDDFNG
jgi:Concanavalin A-like lectin/glucanases superfamily